MGNQFFYTRKEVKPAPKESTEDVQFDTFIDSFNLDEVLRSVQATDGTLLVALKDGHEESRQTGYQPQTTTQKKAGVPGDPIKARIWVQSRIILEGEDIARFRNISNAEYTGSLTGAKFSLASKYSENTTLGPSEVRTTTEELQK